MTTTVHGLTELKALAGKDLDTSSWLEITHELWPGSSSITTPRD